MENKKWKIKVYDKVLGIKRYHLYNNERKIWHGLITPTFKANKSKMNDMEKLAKVLNSKIEMEL